MKTHTHHWIRTIVEPLYNKKGELIGTKHTKSVELLPHVFTSDGERHEQGYDMIWYEDNRGIKYSGYIPLVHAFLGKLP